MSPKAQEKTCIDDKIDGEMERQIKMDKQMDNQERDTQTENDK